MCKNATSTAASLLGAIEPTLKSLLAITGQATTPDGIAAINAFDAAKTALAAWVPGTTSQTVVQALEAFSSVFNVLPIPEDAKILENIILAGVIAVLGVVKANSPAPMVAPPVPDGESASTEETQALHSLSIAQDTTEKVSKLVPEFKRSHFHSPKSQYESMWNKGVEKAGPKYASLKC